MFYQLLITAAIGHVWYINILTWLRGFCLSIPKGDLADTKKTTPNREVCPESLATMLKYRSWAIAIANLTSEKCA